MKRAAIGIRTHSGWGALVAVSCAGGEIEVMERRRIAMTTAGTPGAAQPYHFAANLGLAEAEKFLADRFAESKRLAEAAVHKVAAELGDREYQLVGSAILLAAGRAQPPLAAVLASHALIHAAEGEFFREAFSKACEDANLPVTGIRERNLEERAQTILGKGAAKMLQDIATLGRSLGPPWTKDQKLSALAALLVLAEEV